MELNENIFKDQEYLDSEINKQKKIRDNYNDIIAQKTAEQARLTQAIKTKFNDNIQDIENILPYVILALTNSSESNISHSQNDLYTYFHQKIPQILNIDNSDESSLAQLVQSTLSDLKKSNLPIGQ